jgi:hypothetical protein
MLQPAQHPKPRSTLCIPDLIADLNQIPDEMELLELHPRVPKVVAHSLSLGGTHVDGNLLESLRMAAVPHPLLSKFLPNR